MGTARPRQLPDERIATAGAPDRRRRTDPDAPAQQLARPVGAVGRRRRRLARICRPAGGGLAGAGRRRRRRRPAQERHVVRALPARPGVRIRARRSSSQGMDAESRSTPVGQGAPATPPRRSSSGDPVFDRPIFIVSPPRSGSTLLFETLSAAPGLATIGGESHNLMEQVPAINPAARGWDSNRLTAADADPAYRWTPLRSRFRAALRDRDGVPAILGAPVACWRRRRRTPARSPSSPRVFPEARFIYLHRDPRSDPRQHDRGLALRAVPHLSDPAGVDRPRAGRSCSSPNGGD